jgi:hypothetical protein
MLAPFDGPDRVAGDPRVGEIRALRTFRLIGLSLLGNGVWLLIRLLWHAI